MSPFPAKQMQAAPRPSRLGELLEDFKVFDLPASLITALRFAVPCLGVSCLELLNRFALATGAGDASSLISRLTLGPGQPGLDSLSESASWLQT